MHQVDYIVSLDLGQAHDYSALAVLERSACPDALRYAVRFLQRWPLGTAYTAVVGDVADLVRRPPLAHPLLAVDTTGVGRAVVDALRQSEVAASLFPIVITAGRVARLVCGAVRVPKKELVETLRQLLASQRLCVAVGTAHAGALEKELHAFQVKITAAARETFAARRRSDHDDLVLAVALACWCGERCPPPAEG